MNTKIFFAFIVLLAFIFNSCSQKTSCDQLPETYSTYAEAVRQIKSAQFKIKESVNTSKSSWIKNAYYYSCNEKTGFFIFETAQK